MISAEQIFLAEKWELAFADAIKLLAREEKDLAEYMQKPDANQKAIAIRQQRNDIIKSFCELTKTLITLQGEMLKDSYSTHGALRNVREDLLKYKQYCYRLARDSGRTPHDVDDVIRTHSLKEFGIRNNI